MKRVLARHLWPIVGLTIFFLVGTWKLLSLGVQVRGDLPFYYANYLKNIIFDRLLYSWVPFESLGKPSTFSFDTLQSFLFSLFAFGNDGILHFYIYYLPILLAAIVGYSISHSLFDNKIIAFILGCFYIANPVIFGDFRSGQPMWAYVFLPIMYYLVFLLLRDGTNLRKALMLAVSMFLVVAVLPPILVPLSAFVGVVFLSGIFVFARAPGIFKSGKVLGVGLASVSALTFLLAPILFSASSGQQALYRSSVVGDFLNNYSKTGPENVLRLAGNQGNGQVALGYNGLSVTNTFGFMIFILIVCGLGFRRFKQHSNFPGKYFSLIFLPAVLAVFGFFYITYFDRQIGVNFFTSSWLAATIRNPTKLFVLILFPVTVLMGLGLANIKQLLSERAYPRGVKILYGAVGACLLLYGWPFLRGDMGLFHGRDNSRNMFSPSRLIQQINQREQLSDGARAMMVPTTHLDELNFQSINKSLNALRRAGSDYTTRIQTKLAVLYNDKDPRFLLLARAIGINDIFLKTTNDNDPSYAPFPSSFSFEESSNFLSSTLGLGKREALYSRYSVSSSAPVIYSPKNILRLENYDLDEQLGIAGEGSATIHKSSSSSQLMTNDYERSSTFFPTRRNYVLLNNNKFVRVKIEVDRPENLRKITLRPVDPFGRPFGETIRLMAKSSERYMQLGGKTIDLDGPQEAVSIRSGKNKVKFFTQQYVTDASSQGVEMTGNGDATIGTEGKPDIDISYINQGEAGKKLLRIYAKTHTAYASKTLKFSVARKIETAFVDLTYKTIVGQGPNYVIIDKKTGIYIKRGVLPPHSSQSGELITFSPTPENGRGTYLIYLYSIPGQHSPTENIFSSLTSSSLVASSSHELSIEPYPSNFELDSALAEVHSNPENLLANSSFDDDGGWSGAGDASTSRPGSFTVNARFVETKGSTGKAVNISAKNHNAYISQDVRQFEPNATYRLTFKYKNMRGNKPAVSIIQGGIKAPVALEELASRTTKWQSFEQTFEPDPNASSLTLFLYSPADGGISENAFDDVKIEKLPLVREYLSSKIAGTKNLPATVTSFKQQSPTRFMADLTGNKGLVVLNMSYHKGWRAFIIENEGNGLLNFMPMFKPGKEIPSDQHILVNSFANGWVINPADLNNGGSNQKLILEYWPQRWFVVSLITSSATFCGVLAYLGWDWRRRRRRRKKAAEIAASGITEARRTRGSLANRPVPRPPK